MPLFEKYPDIPINTWFSIPPEYKENLIQAILDIVTNMLAAAATKNNTKVELCIKKFLLFPVNFLRLEYGSNHIGRLKLLESLNRARGNLLPLAMRQKSINPQDQNSNPDDLNAKHVKKLFDQFRFRKAVQQINSNGTADMSVEANRTIIMKQFPFASQIDFPQIPHGTYKRIAIEPDNVRRAFNKMNSDSAGGLSQWTVPLLRTILINDTIAAGLAFIITAMINDEISDSLRPLLVDSRLATPFKEDGGIRGIGQTEIMLRASVRIIKEEMPKEHAEFKSGIQFALAVGGSQTALHRIQGLIEKRAHCAGEGRIYALSNDIKSAFPSVDRSLTVQTFFNDPHCRAAHHLCNFIYKKPSTVVSNTGEKFISAKGVTQGEGLAMLLFCKQIDEVYEKSNDAGRVLDNDFNAAAIADDLCQVGTIPAIRAALLKLKELCTAQGLELNLGKCKLLDVHDDLQPTPQDALDLVSEFGLKLEKGAMKHLGGTIGMDQLKRAQITANMCGKKTDSICKIIENEIMPAQSTVQYASLMLSSAYVHIGSVSTPEICKNPFDDANSRVQKSFLKRMGIEDKFDTPAVRTQLALRRSLGGFGFSTPIQQPALFVTALARAMKLSPDISKWFCGTPSTAGWNALLPHLIPCVRIGVDILDTISKIAHEARGNKANTTVERLDKFKFDETLLSQGVLPLIDEKLPKFHHTNMGTLQVKKIATLDSKLARRIGDISSDSARRFLFEPRATGYMSFKVDDRLFGKIVRAFCGIPHIDLPHDFRCGPPCNAMPDADHAHACFQEKKVSVTERHDAVTSMLKNITHSAGGQTLSEPRMRDAAGLGGKRGDLAITFDGKTTIIDTSIVHVPLTKSSAKDAIKQREQKKRQDYEKLAQVQGVDFVPFVFSSLGSMGNDAEKLLKHISEKAVHFGASTNSSLFFRRSLLSLLMTIHRSNVIIQEKGVRRCKPFQPNSNLL